MLWDLKWNIISLNIDLSLVVYPFLCVWPRLISEKPAENYTVEVSVMGVYNNEVFDLLARDERGNAAGQRRDVITTSSGTSQVTSLTYEWVEPQLCAESVYLYFVIKGFQYILQLDY